MERLVDKNWTVLARSQSWVVTGCGVTHFTPSTLKKYGKTRAGMDNGRHFRRDDVELEQKACRIRGDLAITAPSSCSGVVR